MKWTRFRALFFWLIALAVLGGGLATAHSGKKFAPGISPEVSSKIAPWVLAHTAQGEEIEFLVVLKDQADLRGAAQLATKLEKGRFVRDALWAKAQATQAPLIAWLAERRLPYRSFYIINALWVKASRAVAAELAARPDVARVEGNPQLSGIRPIPEDASNENFRLSLEPNAEPGISAIRATELWALGFNGQGIVIGGQDTGVEWAHPALRAHYRGADGANANHDFNWHDSVHTGGGVCGANSPEPCDDSNHGTHTVGIVLGNDGADNQIGVAPGAKFVACRNMDRGNGTPATYLECFEFMLAPYPVNGTPAQGDPDKAPDLTNNSWGCPSSEGCAPDTLRLAVEAQRAAGIMTIVSAGNEGPACSTLGTPPAQYAAAYSVGAFDASTGLIAGFSSRGPVLADGSRRTKPDIAAPGVRVRSAVRGGNYAFLSGTSMAGPHVVGAIALLWSARPELKNQIALTETLLDESAVHVESADCGSNGWPNTVYGFGRLDVKAAYDLAAATVTPLGDTISFRGGEGQVVVNIARGVRWRAVSNAAWLTVVGADNFTGSGTVVYRVAENNSAEPRTGTLTVAGRTITITQSGTSAFAVSGRVTTQDGSGLPYVTLLFTSLTDDRVVPDSVETDAEGRWSQTGFVPGVTYRVQALQGRQNFEPRAREFSAPTQTLDFKLVARRIIFGAQQGR
jgi:subtilisin family serine protease